MSKQPALPLIVVVGILVALTLLWKIEQHTATSACYDQIVAKVALTPSGELTNFEGRPLKKCEN